MIGVGLELKAEVMALVDSGEPWRTTRGHAGGGLGLDATQERIPELHPTRFDLEDTVGIKAHLQAEGFAVVGDVAGQAELEHARDLLWAHLEGQDCPRMQQARPKGWRRGEPATWRAFRGKGFDAPTSVEPFYGVSHSDAGLMTSTTHSDCLWYARSLPGVRDAFAAALGNIDFVCSYDRMVITLPTSSGNPIALRAGAAPTYDHGSRLDLRHLHVHHNRNPYSQELCYGILNLFDADKSTGSTAVVPRSHVVETFERSSPSDLSEFRKRGLMPCVCVCQAGDLLLIDSGTLHCTCYAEDPTGASGNGPNELLRAACITCMHPVRLLSPTILRARQRAYELDIFTGGSCLTEAAAEHLLAAVESWGSDRNVRNLADAPPDRQQLVDPSYSDPGWWRKSATQGGPDSNVGAARL